jgi:hypothetical protein
LTDLDPVGGDAAAEPDSKAADGAMVTEPDEPFIVKRSNSWGEPNFYSVPRTRALAEPAYFTVDWQSRGGDVFEHEKFDRPEIDESARAAQEKTLEPVVYTLQQCIDVRRQLPLCSVQSFSRHKFCVTLKQSAFSCILVPMVSHN